MSKSSLHTKLAKIRAAFGPVSKTGTNTGVGGGYKFVQANEVARKFVEAASAENLTMVAIGGRVMDRYLSISGKQHVIDLEMVYRITDGDTGEFIDIVGYGQGADHSDKALPKAQTNCMKYAIMAGVLQAAGDDPEADSASNDTGEAPNQTDRVAAAKARIAARSGKAPVPQAVEQAPVAEQPKTFEESFAEKAAAAQAATFTSPAAAAEQAAEPEDPRAAAKARLAARKAAAETSTELAPDNLKNKVRARQHEVELDDDQLKALAYFLTGKQTSKDWTTADANKILEGLDRKSTVEVFRDMKVPAATAQA